MTKRPLAFALFAVIAPPAMERKRFEGGVPVHSRGRGAAMGVGPA